MAKMARDTQNAARVGEGGLEEGVWRRDELEFGREDGRQGRSTAVVGWPHK